MRRTAVALALAFGATRVHAQDLSSFNQQVQLQINLNLMLQVQDDARRQAEEMRRLMEGSPVRWAQPQNDVIPPADAPADMTAIPTFWPRPAQFRGRVVVTMTSRTPFATIYYATDGSIPTPLAESHRYRRLRVTLKINRRSQ